MSTLTWDETQIGKIQALLAKAESTDSSFEAEALIAKAQELMTRYSIDEAVLRSAKKSTDRQPATVSEFDVPGPYAKAKSTLLGRVARNNGCRIVQGSRLNRDQSLRIYLAGFPSDIARVQGLYTSLLIVAQTDMVRERRLNQTVHGKSFAHSFWLGFAQRINTRLKEMAQAITNTVQSEGGASVALALVDRKEQVDLAVNDRFGRSLRSSAPLRSSSYAGHAAGWRSGGQAGLAESIGGKTSGRGALGR